jgi:hypothetical protein
MKKLILFLFTLGISSCKNNTIIEPPVNEFVGTWKLISFCKSSSTAACTPTIVPLDKGVFISFTNDKKFSEFYANNKPFEYAFLGCGNGKYDISGTDLRITALCMSSFAGQKFPIVSVDSKRLVLLYYFNKDEYVFEKQ